MEFLMVADQIVEVIRKITHEFGRGDCADNDVSLLRDSVARVRASVIYLMEHPIEFPETQESLKALLGFMTNVQSFLIKKMVIQTVNGFAIICLSGNCTAEEAVNVRNLLDHCVSQLNSSQPINLKAQMRDQYQRLLDSLLDPGQVPHNVDPPLDMLRIFYEFMMRFFASNREFVSILSFLYGQDDHSSHSRGFNWRDFIKENKEVTDVLLKEVERAFMSTKNEAATDYYEDPNVQSHQFSYFDTGFMLCIGRFAKWLKSNPEYNDVKLNAKILETFKDNTYESSLDNSWWWVFWGEPKTVPLNRCRPIRDGFTLCHLDMQCEHEFVPGTLANMSKSKVTIKAKYKKFTSWNAMLLWRISQPMTIPTATPSPEPPPTS